MARILLVEADPSFQDYLENIISQYAPNYYESPWTLRFTKVRTHTEAYRLLDEHAFELVICDVQTAKLDGYEFVHQVRRRKSHIDLPIVVISAIDSICLEYECKRSGASLWFTRPLASNEDFVRQIFALLLDR